MISILSYFLRVIYALDDFSNAFVQYYGLIDETRDTKLFDSSKISNTKKNVSSDFQTPRRGAAEFFKPTSRCLETG